MVGVRVGVPVLVGVRVFVGVRVIVGVRVMVGVRVLVGVRVFVGIRVSVAARVFAMAAAVNGAIGKDSRTVAPIARLILKIISQPITRFIFYRVLVAAQTALRRDFTRLVHIAIGQLKKAGFFVIISPRYIVAHSHGEVPEWLNGAVSKTAVALWVTQGSNPCLSARMKGKSMTCPFCFVAQLLQSHFEGS